MTDGENCVNPHDSADGYVPQAYLGADPVDCEAADRADEDRIRQRFEDLRVCGAEVAGQPHRRSSLPVSPHA
ncbi:MAG: hypothetical protein ACYSTY_09305 [Planctomycetota bacterium]